MLNFAESIWVADQEQKFFGLELGARMTVVKLGGGGLLVHSPVRLSSRLAESLNALGKVAYVVAPNKWHHLYLNGFKEAFPEAQFFCANGLEKKRPDFRFDGVIGKGRSFPWNPEIEHAIIDGVPLYNEVVFFHRSSYLREPFLDDESVLLPDGDLRQVWLVCPGKEAFHQG